MKRVVEGSLAVAEAVKLCRPRVVSAYPITPQTHIVEWLAKFVAEGELPAEVVNVESEHSAASVVLGATASGARSYTATSSQGLILMAEVLFNISGLRLPVVMGVANRALSAPINIWNDQQDSMSLRDSGWVQVYAENNQTALDWHIAGYRLAELASLPVMICMDGYILTHAYEPVDIPEQRQVDAFLPPFKPKIRLDPDSPITLGVLTEPDAYLETRYALHQAMEEALNHLEKVGKEFSRIFGRDSIGLVEGYRLEGAEVAVVATGSVVGTVKEAVDDLRKSGRRVGALSLRVFRPFPRKSVHSALQNIPHIAVLEKALSPGGAGILAADLKDALYGNTRSPHIARFIAGLGGRDITLEQIEEMVLETLKGQVEEQFLGLNPSLLEQGEG